MTQSNTGGWILTTLDNAFGGSVETGAGKTGKAAVDTPQMKAVFEMLKTMRWTDNSMGANFLYDWSAINQAFASGQLAMYVSGGGNYGNLFTQNKMNPDDYGLSVIPLTDSKNAGVLGGGTLAAVSAKAEGAAGRSRQVDRLLLHGCRMLRSRLRHSWLRARKLPTLWRSRVDGGGRGGRSGVGAHAPAPFPRARAAHRRCTPAVGFAADRTEGS